MIRKILRLGEPALYDASRAMAASEMGEAAEIVEDLKDTMMEFRRTYGFGRAIAAPQIGHFRRIIFMDAGSPTALVNPVLSFPDDQMMEVMDDCMCFPGLFVKVLRHRRCRVDYLDLSFKPASMDLEGDLSELIQHEYDHLDGILATMRAIDGKSFSFYKVLPVSKEDAL